ncbi:SGNH/GDSL hydrolase family protein [Roseiconus lacunae]|uniref:SGNH/GDSL hydrolase family protein n=1 Tax=Roseiconus lacunae TaxID=2605694 RepID=A0ABT7PIZ7_9BACT|nr:SGNH/GDSL hydrolase family protein [Roseiconus lacunae]MDM4016472.1 SGNH/GDSL hydrolase family protein [Roseiconus lacunae]
MIDHQILIYSDSLTWGIIPNTRNRLPFELRWPGVLENALRERGVSARVIEDCLNGRRTAFDDPEKPGRSGLEGVEQKIEMHSPLRLVVLMLGTNDFQAVHANTIGRSAQGMASLVAAVRRAPIEPDMPIPQILIVAPPPVGQPKGEMAYKFDGAKERCEGLSSAFEQVARGHDCGFFDAGSITTTSKIDGVHLDEDQHEVLGLAIADVAECMIIQ